MLTPEQIALTRWDEMIREEARSLADRDNECEACCGPYGTATWKEYEQQVRSHFEKIGAAYYLAVRAELERIADE